MKKSDARKIAEDITNESIVIMFENAKNNISDWTKTSIVNKGLTVGVAWNILAKDFDINGKYHIIAKTNMIREFGEYLSEDLKPIKAKKIKITPSHQNPIFN